MEMNRAIITRRETASEDKTTVEVSFLGIPIYRSVYFDTDGSDKKPIGFTAMAPVDGFHEEEDDYLPEEEI